MTGGTLHKAVVPTLTLFTSLSTLLCCALPALLVSLGAGAAVIGLVGAFPQLIWLSAHKRALFAVAGLLILGSGLLRWKNRHAPCPLDPAQARACMRLRRVSAIVFYVSVGCYAVGVFFAFLAPRLLG